MYCTYLYSKSFSPTEKFVEVLSLQHTTYSACLVNDMPNNDRRTDSVWICSLTSVGIPIVEIRSYNHHIYTIDFRELTYYLLNQVFGNKITKYQQRWFWLILPGIILALHCDSSYQGCTKWRTPRTSLPQADFDRAKKWFQNQAEQIFHQRDWSTRQTTHI